MPIARRTIDEVVALHDLEGSDIREVFVEGLSDKYFLEHFLIEYGLADVGVYEIETVEVPTDEVLKRGLEDGNRGRVVTLACLLEDQVQVNELVCIADADFDHFKEIVHNCALLLVSDYCSVELYAFNERTLSKLFRLVAGGFPKRADVVLTQIRGLLEAAFLIRMANHDLGLGCEVPEAHKFCAYDSKKDTITFRENDFITTMVGSGVKKGVHLQVAEFVKERRLRLKVDPRLQIHGHDFYQCLSWFVRQHSGFKAIHPTTIPDSLTACIECAWLANEGLFEELLRRLRS
jgi:hypothetical protein